MPSPKKKPVAKKKPTPVAKSRPGPAKVLQHPSSAPHKASTAVASPLPQKAASRPGTPKPPSVKREAKDWKDFHGLTSVDFEDLVERRQTVYHKLKDLEIKLKGKPKTAKDHEETRKASLDGQIQALLKEAGVHDNSVIVGERTVTLSIGHTPERISSDKLMIKLLDYLEAEQIEEIMSEVTEGGDPYDTLRITEPKKESD